jgi:hypothetical protein
MDFDSCQVGWLKRDQQNIFLSLLASALFRKRPLNRNVPIADKLKIVSNIKTIQNIFFLIVYLLVLY